MPQMSACRFVYYANILRGLFLEILVQHPRDYTEGEDKIQLTSMKNTRLVKTRRIGLHSRVFCYGSRCIEVRNVIDPGSAMLAGDLKDKGFRETREWFVADRLAEATLGLI